MTGKNNKKENIKKGNLNMSKYNNNVLYKW